MSDEKMKKVMIVFEIPEDETIEPNVIPKLSHCRLNAEGVDLFCSTPVKIIDDQSLMSEVEYLMEKHGTEWKPRVYPQY